GPGGRVAGKTAHSQTALSGGRTGLPGFLCVGQAWLVHRTVIPGATVPVSEDVRGLARPRQTAGQERLQPDSAGGSARTAARNGRRAPGQWQTLSTRAGRRLNGGILNSIINHDYPRTYSRGQVPGRR